MMKSEIVAAVAAFRAVLEAIVRSLLSLWLLLLLLLLCVMFLLLNGSICLLMLSSFLFWSFLRVLL